MTTTVQGACIIWQRARTRDGYGVVNHDGKLVRAHRLAYANHHGISLSEIDGLVVRHRCDNPPCVNPDHLEIGTHADNAKDKVERGRTLRGEDQPSAKLTAEIVAYCREVYIARDKEFGATALARRFGVTQSAISRVILRNRWN
ncbi:HNH endonuclease signature motif containing protein [Burkholderia cenocepacia]|uniref:HNH endonuclease signature motif containing protein n=1 Tax=Burkholderia cenocepacia TaxID=95486 RepID=UPI002B251B2D|nr:HNH endonuclease signature motif containing protein [Burkholderia cenocepacia]MEB2544316.1 HNH endonuclease signature motif containing protein [Burkholderia cenocepacia]